MAEKPNLGDQPNSSLSAGGGCRESVGVYLVYDLVARDRRGRYKWRRKFKNLVTTEGKNDILDKYFRGAGYTAAWYVGLKGVGAPAATDTAASHPNWPEITAYSQPSRPALTLGAPASGSATTTTAARFDITGGVTVAGAFTATDGGKGGVAGKIYSAGDFATARTLVAGDVLNVNITLQA